MINFKYQHYEITHNLGQMQPKVTECPHITLVIRLTAHTLLLVYLCC